ncbi:MAG: CBS domain-containing protein [Pseudomonadota bacterium]
MKVSVILQHKANHDIATIGPDATVAEAISMLSTQRIGALVVSSGDSRVDGIVSERDIVRRLGADGAGALQTTVRDAMTSEVECCSLDETAIEVLGRMTQGRFRHMPVTDALGRMTGILSIGDVVKARLEEIEAENAAMVDMLSH